MARSASALISRESASRVRGPSRSAWRPSATIFAGPAIAPSASSGMRENVGELLEFFNGTAAKELGNPASLFGACGGPGRVLSFGGQSPIHSPGPQERDLPGTLIGIFLE